jgi:hypothetical protein
VTATVHPPGPAAWAGNPQRVTLEAAAIARLCAWLQTAELPPAPLETLPGVQAFDIELLRHQLLASIAAGLVGYGPAVGELRYLAAGYGPAAIHVLARPAARSGERR